MPGTIKGSLTKGSRTFEYAETKSGKSGAGPRGICIWIKGTANGQHNYGINPNPHDNRKYNKKQDAFYLQAATVLAEFYTSSAVYPAPGVLNFNFGKEEYSLDVPH